MKPRTKVFLFVAGVLLFVSAFTVLQMESAKGERHEAAVALVIQQARLIIQAQGDERRLLASLYACGKKSTALNALTSNELMNEAAKVKFELNEFALKLHRPWLIQLRYGDADLVKQLNDHVWQIVNDEFQAATESAAEVLSNVSDAERSRYCDLASQRVNALLSPNEFH